MRLTLAPVFIAQDQIIPEYRQFWNESWIIDTPGADPGPGLGRIWRKQAFQEMAHVKNQGFCNMSRI